MKPELDLITMEMEASNHTDEKKTWPWYIRFFHWSLVSWRCSYCKIERENRKAKMKL